MSHCGETWILRLQLPAGLVNPGRYVARLLKHLLHVWGVKCVAVAESAEVRRLQRIITGLAARVAGQSELLGRAAERNGRTSPPSATSGIAATNRTSGVDSLGYFPGDGPQGML